MALETDDTATSIRDGLLTDGPFIETKEGLAGITVIEARDLDHALELAKLVPIVRGGVEVRPMLGLCNLRLSRRSRRRTGASGRSCSPRRCA